jgi:hypothetical protein
LGTECKISSLVKLASFFYSKISLSGEIAKYFAGEQQLILMHYILTATAVAENI